MRGRDENGTAVLNQFFTEKVWRDVEPETLTVDPVVAIRSTYMHGLHLLHGALRD